MTLTHSNVTLADPWTRHDSYYICMGPQYVKTALVNPKCPSSTVMQIEVKKKTEQTVISP